MEQSGFNGFTSSSSLLVHHNFDVNPVSEIQFAPSKAQSVAKNVNTVKSRPQRTIRTLEERNPDFVISAPKASQPSTNTTTPHINRRHSDVGTTAKSLAKTSQAAKNNRKSLAVDKHATKNVFATKSNVNVDKAKSFTTPSNSISGATASDDSSELDLYLEPSPEVTQATNPSKSDKDHDDVEIMEKENVADKWFDINGE